MPGYNRFFEQFSEAKLTPHNWQIALASSTVCSNRLIRIPTGFGKTLGVLAAWIWHRVQRKDDTWPRRLIWCLPMRVLVEQTEQEVRRTLQTLGILWKGDNHDNRVGVHLLMGGADSEDWHLHPEACAVLIGTQDMLLSRAMNRGYGASRARWPMEFGLLNQDCLWVMDEVQLMDVGLATSMQLQAFRDDDNAKGRSIRPCYSWWMSATLQSEWLSKSPDTIAMARAMAASLHIPAADRHGHLWDDVIKPCRREIVQNEEEMARFIVREYLDGGTVLNGPALVVVNTVRRAVRLYDALLKENRLKDEGIDICLVHSRFRPVERRSWQKLILHREACAPGTKRIIVATQVIEAGVDISAALLMTELAPWPSLVQRFGRCARWGGTGRILVADFLEGQALLAWEQALKKYQKEVVKKPKTKKPDRDEIIEQVETGAALPYVLDEVRAAREALGHLEDVSPLNLEAFEESHPRLLPGLYSFEPAHLLLRHEIDELFDTTPDLSGADVDISRFIRSGEERDLHVFWVPVVKNENPASDLRPTREVLCAVPFLAARIWLCGEEKKTQKRPRLKEKMRAWVWDWVEGLWRVAERHDLYPGQTVLVDAACGGYDPERGWWPESQQAVAAVNVVAPEPMVAADDALESDSSSILYQWQTIAVHGREVGRLAHSVAAKLAPAYADLFDLIGRLHDWGKAHPAFNGSITGPNRPERQDLAKAPASAWLHLSKLYPIEGETRRIGLRHEVASTLALFTLLQRLDPDHKALLGRPWRELLTAAGFVPLPPSVHGDASTPIERELIALEEIRFNLAAYLVCAHHGKARLAWHATAADQRAEDDLPRIMGLKNGDKIPTVTLADTRGTFHDLPGFTLNLSPASAGLNPTTGMGWTERVIRLIETYGPFTLAWFEAMFRAADQRASRLEVTDDLLNPEEMP